jgi:hypothetical protein
MSSRFSRRNPSRRKTQHRQAIAPCQLPCATARHRVLDASTIPRSPSPRVARCPNFSFRGVRVDVAQPVTDESLTHRRGAVTQVELHPHSRPVTLSRCSGGVGSRGGGSVRSTPRRPNRPQRASDVVGGVPGRLRVGSPSPAQPTRRADRGMVAAPRESLVFAVSVFSDALATCEPPK